MLKFRSSCIYTLAGWLGQHRGRRQILDFVGGDHYREQKIITLHASSHDIRKGGVSDLAGFARTEWYVVLTIFAGSPSFVLPGSVSLSRGAGYRGKSM